MAVLAVSLAYAAVQGLHRLSVKRLVGLKVPAPVVVLTYHAVPEEEAPRFRQQMRDLVALATPVFADSAPEDFRDRPAAAVTFDDGLQSVFEQALPIMAEYRIPATVFVPTGSLGGPPGWIPASRRQHGSSGVLASVGTLTALDRRWVRLGSHTVTHPHLDCMPATSVVEELVGSKQALEQITTASITMLSFPYGSFNADVLDTARATGYTHLFANVPMRADDAGSVRLLGRVNVSPRDSQLEFRLKVQGAYQWLAVAIPIKRAVLRCLGRGRP